MPTLSGPLVTYLLLPTLTISLLVFLTASTPFLLTSLYHYPKERIGTATGTLGFADELVALLSSPLWGTLSDRIGIRYVSTLGFVIMALGLVGSVTFPGDSNEKEDVQDKDRRGFPYLLVSRMVFALGAAACVTMITAGLSAVVEHDNSKHGPSSIIPEHQHITSSDRESERNVSNGSNSSNRDSVALSIDSEATITPTRLAKSSLLNKRLFSRTSTLPATDDTYKPDRPSIDASQLAGFVGMFSGLGALVALFLYLPLPTYFTQHTQSQAITSSFYIIACLSLSSALIIFYGFRNLHRTCSSPSFKFSRIVAAIRLSFGNSDILLGYLGGFVARSASVCISTFIPLFVASYFIHQGTCSASSVRNPLKENCNQAYVLASMLTGTSQLVALMTAPVYGFVNAYFSHDDRASGMRGKERWWTLGIAALFGAVGSCLFGFLHSPKGGIQVVIAVIFMGLGQIGTIVCSLGILSRGTKKSETNSLRNTERNEAGNTERNENEPLLVRNNTPLASIHGEQDTSLKGSIAGMYSFSGGVGILLLTKLGGYLFDNSSAGAPFFLMSAFNVLLFLTVVILSITSE